MKSAGQDGSGTFWRMTIDAQFMAFSSSFLALLTVLFAVALVHPEPPVRERAERLLALLLRAR